MKTVTPAAPYMKRIRTGKTTSLSGTNLFLKLHYPNPAKVDSSLQKLSIKWSNPTIRFKIDLETFQLKAL
jgi:hypothetical protein